MTGHCLLDRAVLVAKSDPGGRGIIIQNDGIIKEDCDSYCVKFRCLRFTHYALRSIPYHFQSVPKGIQTSLLLSQGQHITEAAAHTFVKESGALSRLDGLSRGGIFRARFEPYQAEG